MRRIFWLLGCFVLLAPAFAQTVLEIEIQGHRGARGLFPENTMSGFKRTAALGINTLELDLVATKDDVLVLSHDPFLNPDLTRDETGAFLTSTGPLIRSLDYAQLQAFDVGRLKPGTGYARRYPKQQGIDGERISPFTRLLDWMSTPEAVTVRLAVELKSSPLLPNASPEPAEFVELLIGALKDRKLEGRVSVLSFDWRVLQALKSKAPAIPRVFLTAQLKELNNLQIGNPDGSAWTAGYQYSQYGSVPRMLHAAGAQVWSSFFKELNANTVSEAQALGLRVLAWTVNEESDMDAMLSIGVDGLVTDRPDLAQKLIERRGWRWR